MGAGPARRRLRVDQGRRCVWRADTTLRCRENGERAEPGTRVCRAIRRSASRTDGGFTFNATYTAAVVTLGDEPVWVLVRQRPCWRACPPSRARSKTPAFSQIEEMGRVRSWQQPACVGGQQPVTSGRSRSDRGPKVLNGRLDWVWDHGRGQQRAYWWSPTRRDRLPASRRHAGADVHVVDHVRTSKRRAVGLSESRRSESARQARRRTGSPGSPTWMDTSKYPAADHLVVRVGWTPDSRRVVYEVQNRTQTWLDLNLGDAASGAHARPSCAKPASSGSAPTTSSAADVAERRIVSLAERSIGMAAPLSLHSRRHADQAGDERQMGAADAARRRRDGRLGLLLRHRAKPHRRRRLPDQAGRLRTRSGCRRPTARTPRSSARRSASTLDTWSNVTTPPQTRLHKSDGTRGARHRREQGRRRSASTGCRSRSSCR